LKDSGISAEFVSYDRNLGTFEATFEVGPEPAHAVRLEVRSFNELTLARYTGHAFTRGPAGIAGRGVWKGIPFGFLARPQPPVRLGPDRPGGVTLADFVGAYDLLCDGLHATLLLQLSDASELTGVLVEDDGTRHHVVPAPDPDVAHHLLCSVELPGGPAELDLLMFVRSRTVLAGHVDWRGHRYGCSATRINWSGCFPGLA
jgi:hypothetical protein